MIFPVTQLGLNHIASGTLSTLDVVGQQTVLTGQMAAAFTKKGWWRLTCLQMGNIGLPILAMGILMSTTFGMVIALQVAKEMVKQGAGQFVGTLVSMAVIRELGPLMTGFSGIAIAGSAFTSELITMRLTQQMDALQMMRVSPIRYLGLPRLLAAMITLPLVNVVSITAGVLGGYLVALRFISGDVYFESIFQQTKLWDVGYSCLKTLVFGFLLGVIAIHTGLSGRGTSADMVSLTTKSVVRSFVAMAVADYIITGIVY